MNRQESIPCFVFPLGMEMGPFLHRVEVRRRWKVGRATYREAFFEGRTLLVVRCGIGPIRAAEAIRNLELRPGAILSLGTAGALVPEILLGDLIVASETLPAMNADLVLKGSAALIEAVSEACRLEQMPHRTIRLVTVTTAVFARQAREELHRATGAEAVDMESHAIALAAMDLGVPFTALRVISDDLHAPPLPQLAGLRRLWQSPWKLPHELVLFLQWKSFLSDFRRVVKFLPPVLLRLIRSGAFGSVQRAGERL
jgi:nucleoside phosphorylase